MFSDSQCLDIRNEQAFLNVFKEHDIAKNFISNFLSDHEEEKRKELKSLEVANFHVNPSHHPLANDIGYVDKAGNYYSIEIHNYHQFENYSESDLTDLATSYVGQIKKMKLSELYKSITSVTIQNFERENSVEVFSQKVYFDESKPVKFILLNPGNFTKTSDLSPLDEWIYFFKNSPKMTVKDLFSVETENKALKKAYSFLSCSTWGKFEYLAYVKEGMRVSDLKSLIKEKFEEGVRIGMEMSAMKLRKKVARSLLKKYSDVQRISRVTGLSEEDVETLKNDM